MINEPHTDAIRNRCSQMTDIELIHALTVDKNDFSEQFHQIADMELTRRGLTLQDFLNRVRVRINNGPEQASTIQEAVEQIPSLLPLWETRFFTNSLGHVLFFQKEAMWIRVHFDLPEGQNRSFFIESESGLKDAVQQFLNLEPVDVLPDHEIRLDSWRIVAESDSPDLIRIISGMMAENSIPSAVKSQEYRGCACGGGRLKVMVPHHYEKDARHLVKELDKERDKLYDAASGLPDDAAAADAAGIYQRLAVLAPDDAVVLFNYGTVLFDMEHWDDAAEAFTRSAYADLRDEENGRNCLDYLSAISQKRTGSAEILHTCAALSAQLNADPESIAAIYRRILETDPKDGIARLNLAYLLIRHEGSETEAGSHFQKYLEINPEAEDSEQIKAILDQLSNEKKP
ncbi:hypothetical protein JW948_01945 [bacterium]|nr:hypothetical protein [bacterium]